MFRISYNIKNNDVHSATFDVIAENLRTFKRFQTKNSVMDCSATQWKIVPEIYQKGLKTNGEYYRQEILATHLLPRAERLYPKKNFIFHQDSPPFYRSKQHRYDSMLFARS